MLKNLIQQEVPRLIFLVEMRLLSKRIELLKKDFGMSNGVFVDCDYFETGRKGGLCMLWKNYLQVNLTSFSLHHIDDVVKEVVQKWGFIGIYS